MAINFRGHLRTAITATAVCIGIALIWLPAAVYYLFNESNHTNGDNTGPILVSMQKLGDLHTARISLKQEVDQNSSEHASGWLKAVPGVNWLVGKATRNQAVVIADGTVEAGINLSKLTAGDVRNTVQNGVSTMTVHLPPIQLYPPNVTVHVISQSGSLFYNDKNIVPQAQAHAATLFASEAQQMHIEDQARTSAIQQLTGLTTKFGVKHVVFVF